MMSIPTVSVVIPCFNAERWIGDAIRSALAQTWPDVEVIVVDDGSTDGSREVIGAFAERVECIFTANQGAGAARNVGIESAAGEYVQFLDSDDVLLPNCVAAKVAMATECAVCPASSWKTVLEDGVSLEIVDPDLNGDAVVAQLQTSMQTSSPLHRREDLLAVGGFDESLPCSQERDLHLRLAAGGVAFKLLPQVLHEFRRREGSISSDHFRVLLQHEKIFLRVIDILRESGGWNADRAVAFARALARDGQHLMRSEQHVDAGQRYFSIAREISPKGMRLIYSHPLKRGLATVLGPPAVERWLGGLTQ